MSQKGNEGTGWSVDSLDKEISARKARFEELTRDDRVKGWEANYQLDREDNEALVKMRTEKTGQGQRQEEPAQKQMREPEPTQAHSSFEYHGRQSRNYEELKPDFAGKEQASARERGEDDTRGADEPSQPKPESEKKPELDERSQRFMAQMERSFSRDDIDRSR
jgi:hypothetical protein